MGVWLGWGVGKLGVGEFGVGELGMGRGFVFWLEGGGSPVRGGVCWGFGRKWVVVVVE